MQQKAKFLSLLSIFVLLATANCLICETGQFAEGILCLPCQKLAHTSESQLLKNSCSCLKNYRWSQSEKACLRQNNLKSDATSKETQEEEGDSMGESVHRRLQSVPNCESAKGYIQYTQSSGKVGCVHCSAFTYSDGTASSNTTCNCISPTQWSNYSSYWTCACIGSANSLYINGSKCEYCSKLPYDTLYFPCASCQTNFGNSYLGCLNCSSVVKATGAALTNGLCACVTGFAFVYATARCECDWATQKYYVNAAGVCTACTTATCNTCSGDYFYFNGTVCVMGSSVANYNVTSGACIAPYSLYQDVFTAGTVGCGCVSVGTNYVYINGVTCTTCTFSLTNVCPNCATAGGYYYSNGQCIKCMTIPYSDGTTYSWGCGCAPTYFFNISSSKCECNITQGYYKLANGSCFNCSALSNTNMATVGGCLCQPGFSWSGTACVCNAALGGYNTTKGCIVCVGMVGSKGTVSTSGCVCVAGYFWNVTSLRCDCDYLQGFFPINGVCTDCWTVALTDGTASAAGCGCKNAYIFVNNVCSCPQGSNLFINEGFCSSCSSTLPVPLTQTDCSACDTTKGFYLDETGRCIYCLNLPMATGASSTGCSCQPGAIWSSEYVACVCSYYWGYNYDYVNGAVACTSCLSTEPCWNCQTSSGLWLDPYYRSCSICSHFPNAKAAATPDGCTCNAGYAWNKVKYPFGCVCSFSNGGFLQAGACKVCLTGSTELVAGCQSCSLAKSFFLSANGSCINCKTVANGNSAVLPTSLGCACKAGWKWSLLMMICLQQSTVTCSGKQILDPLTNTCECPAPYIQGATDCICNAAAGFATLSDTTCIDCYSVAEATGAVSNKQCVCNNNLVWDGVGGSCGCASTSAFISSVGCVDCVGLANSNKVVNPTNPSECSCLNNLQFYYEAAAGASCGCQSPYTLLPSGSCGCEDTSISLPDGSCFSCSIANSLGSLDPNNNQACACSSTYSFIWDSVSSSGVCGCDSRSADVGTGCLDCTLVTDSSGKVDPLSPTACECNGNLLWDYTNSEPACLCPLPYTALPSHGVCSCDPAISLPTSSGCFSCDILHADGTADPADPTRCNCNPSFIFDWDSLTETGQCVCGESAVISQDTCYACSNVAQSTGKANPNQPGECLCNDVFLFHWNLDANNNYVGSCDCPDGYILSVDKCICDPAVALTKTDGTCFSCSITGSDGTVSPSNSSACNCLSGSFIWNSDSQTGICDCVLPQVYSTDKKTCVCSTTISIDIGNGACFDCRGLPNSNNVTLRSNRSKCSCVSPYAFIWNNVTKTGICGCAAGYMKTPNGNCFNCRISRATGAATADGSACVCNSGFSFVWDASAETGSCQCLAPNILSKNGNGCLCNNLTAITLANKSCFSCSITNNAGGLAKNGSACACDAGYIFSLNTTGGTCKCDTTKALTAGCYACSKVDKSTGDALSATTCKCAGNLIFSWYAANGTGSCGCGAGSTVVGTNVTTWKCVCANNYILLGTSCLSCDIPNNALKTNKTATTCNCDAGYIFSSTSNVPKCSCNTAAAILVSNKCFSCVLPNGPGTPANTTACKCNATFTWKWDAAQLTGSCDCPLPKVVTGTTCGCPATSITLTTSAACFSCVGLPNSAGTVNSANKSACNCVSPYVFVYTAGTQTGACLCKSDSFVLNGACFSCTTLKNGNGTVVGGKSCGCKAPYTWRSSDNTCSCPGNSVVTTTGCTVCPSTTANGTGTIDPNNSSACLCANNFKWDGKSACKCLAPFLYSSTSKACSCPSPYTLDASSNCICPAATAITKSNSCFACSGDIYSTGSAANATACACKPTFSWLNTNSCSCNSSAVIVTTNSVASCKNCDATIFAKTKSGAVCTCLSSTMTWNATTGTCGCSATSVVVQNGSSYLCVTCNNNTYSSGKASATACTCSIAGMTWVSAKSSCGCDSTSILTSQLSCLACPSNGVVPIGKYHCGCPTNSIWNDITNACVACNTIASSTNLSVNPLVCGCVSGFYWDVMTLSCTANTATCTAAKAVVSCLKCQSIPNTLNTTPTTKVTASTFSLAIGTSVGGWLAGTNTIYAKLSGFMCNCKAGFKWESKMYRCYDAKTTLT